MYYKAPYTCPLGKLTMVSDGQALIRLDYEKNHDDRQDLILNHAKDLLIFRQTKAWLDTYFQGQVPNFRPAIKLEASDFRRQVWEILLAIPYGQTMTYGQIGQIIADRRGLEKMSAQAVGGAVGHNPISIIIPCHRVIGRNKELTGYGGGLERKRFLLTLEGIAYRENKD